MIQKFHIRVNICSKELKGCQGIFVQKVRPQFSMGKTQKQLKYPAKHEQISKCGVNIQWDNIQTYKRRIF
jgi:hypothetical protein